MQAKHFAGLGGLLLLAACIPGWAPPGPWGVPSFTRGVVGLFGLFLLYRGWFQWNFGRDGIIPDLRLWAQPKRSTRQLVAVGLLCLLNGNIVGNHVQFLPEPTGLILSLFGMLMLTLGAYAWAVFEGPFAIPVEPLESE